MIFGAVGWAEDHHDICAMAGDGAVLAKRRVSDSVGGIGEPHQLVAAHSEENEAVVVGIELDRGLVVTALLPLATWSTRSIRRRRPAIGSATRPRGRSSTREMRWSSLTWCARTDTTIDQVLVTPSSSRASNCSHERSSRRSGAVSVR